MLNNTGFEFPTKIERTRNLSDMLEDVVDEKFYISNEKAEKLISQLTEKSKTDKKCVDGTINKPDFIDIANCIKARYDCGISNFKQDGTMVVEPVLIGGEQANQAVKTDGVSTCLTSAMGSGGGYVPMVTETRPCLTPDRIEKRQNGRRFKEDGEDMFTLTGQDRHGVLQVGDIVDTGNWDNPQRGRIYSADGCSPSLNCVGGGGLEPKILEDFYTNREPRVYDDCPTQRADRQGLKVINNYRIRKLTPRECWRLMGFSDECFEKAEQVNSNSQLYKQAGNSIVVDVLVGIVSQIMIARQKWLDDLLGGI